MTRNEALRISRLITAIEDYDMVIEIITDELNKLYEVADEKFDAISEEIIEKLIDRQKELQAELERIKVSE